MTWQIGDTIETWADRNDIVHTDGAYFPGLVGQDFTMPDQAAFAPTTSLSVRVAVTANDYTPAANQTLASQGLNATTDRCWNFNLSTNNRLSFTLGTTGTAATAYSATASSGTDVDGTTRTCFRADWTASPAEIKFWQKPYVSPEDMALDSGWVQLGSTVTASVPATALFNSSARVRLGSFAGDSNLYTGVIHAAQIQVNGTTVASPRFDQGRSSSIFDAQGNQWTRDGVAPTVSPIFTGTVTVPAITAASQAAQVTAYDAVTGRLAIGGVEMGDTGWRRIVSWTSGVQDASNQFATINAGFTLTGNGYADIRRVGSIVHLRFPDFSNSIVRTATGLTAFFSTGTWPSGFTWGAVAGEGFSVSTFDPVGTLPSIPARFQRQTVGTDVRVYCPIAGLRLCEGMVFTNVAWPTSLPGVAV